MRAALLLVVLTFTFVSPATAQTSGLELQAGLGYARAFDGGGLSFAAAVERPIAGQTSSLQHALGGSLWYSQLSIGSAPGSSNERRLMGLGMRYQMELRRCCGRVHPFLAVPVQVLRSDIPDRSTLQASMLAQGVPDHDPAAPVEDRTGAEWGWGAGLEIGFRLGLLPQLSAQTSVLGLYHRIYEGGNRNGAWTLHGGISYQP